jgi:hypothetical protein
MPKRSTATFTSEDAPPSEEAQLFVYYCRYSGEHCLITDEALEALPRRRTDGALVLDSEEAVVRMQAQPQPPKYIKRCVAPCRAFACATVLRARCALGASGGAACGAADVRVAKASAQP